MNSTASPALNQCAYQQQLNVNNNMAAKRTLWVVLITASMMVIEIVAGTVFNSMALLADGWHMSTHALALAISLFAYVFARKYAQHQRFSFGTWKIEILGGYSSALLLMGVAIFMAVHAVDRILNPQAINYNPAILVAIIGLVVNLVCARLLHDSGTHAHNHGHAGHTHQHSHDHHPTYHDQDHNQDHDHHHDHAHDQQVKQAKQSPKSQDLNLRAAYIHVLADALTSVFAIVALLAGKFFGLNWLDPLMAILGSLLIATWSIGLLKQTALALLDADIQPHIQAEIKALLAQANLTSMIHDLHVWRVGQNQYACILSLDPHSTLSVAQVKQQLSQCHELVHITVESV